MSGSVRLALFDTALGVCGVAWREAGLVATHLPAASEDETRRALAARVGGAREAAPPPAIEKAMADIVRLLAGEKPTLADIVLDETGLDPFRAKVYALARAIPPGETRTYGDLAKDLGDKSLAQAVGQALGANPWPIVVPCHRVLGAGGKLTGFSAPGGVATKVRMLSIEGARIGEGPGLFGELPLAARPGR